MTEQEFLKLQAALQSDSVQTQAFRILQQLCRHASLDASEPRLQDLVLLALEQRERLGSSRPILDALVRRVGLFPYLDPSELSTADQLAYELHRPPGMGEEVVFHHSQARVFQRLLDGESIVLSAPTSFGKSLITDAVIAARKFKNLLILVPTIALIDETRRRLVERFSPEYKIITHATQETADRNIFVMTQERALELKGLSSIDFFVIDEFYKLSPGREGDDRCILLNHALYKLIKTKAQFYMLGPNILGLAEGLEERLDCTFVHEPVKTVRSQIHYLKGTEDRLSDVEAICAKLEGPTIVFCRSPKRAAEIALRLSENSKDVFDERLAGATRWLGENYHSDWHFVKALRAGIGVHHGRIPRALGQYVVRLFNDGILERLVCTSTLIEGVNTRAKNIIISDSTINREPIDFFTFSNIKGRSGRMGRYFTGHVYVFDAPPQDELPLVDVPAFTQPESVSATLLMQLDEEELSPRSRERIRPLLSQGDLPPQTIRQNVGIDPVKQIELARQIYENAEELQPQLAWTGLPTTAQLAFVCELIWKTFDGRALGQGCVRSHKQLAFLLGRLRSAPTTRELINSQLAYWGPEKADEVVQNVLDFLRLWANFHFPRLLRGLSRIQAEVLRRAGLPGGDYEFFARRVEHFFLDPAISTLDEYGVPLEIARRLQGWLAPSAGIDDGIQRLRGIPARKLGLSEFEVSFILDAQEHV